MAFDKKGNGTKRGGQSAGVFQGQLNFQLSGSCCSRYLQTCAIHYFSRHIVVDSIQAKAIFLDTTILSGLTCF